MSSRHSAGVSPRVSAFAFFARRFAGARFSPDFRVAISEILSQGRTALSKGHTNSAKTVAR
jgi:hypothetical protein